jgi:regulator of protease activity HflC (stomatin/prohibitin superfamily)
MEKQMRAEREKRSVILTSEGVRDAAVNTAEGEKQKSIKASEAVRQKQINEAEGQAQAILSIASATAEGINRVAAAIQAPGGFQAVQLRVKPAIDWSMRELRSTPIYGEFLVPMHQTKRARLRG